MADDAVDIEHVEEAYVDCSGCIRGAVFDLILVIGGGGGGKDSTELDSDNEATEKRLEFKTSM